MWIKLDYKRRNVQASITRIHRLVESLPEGFLTHRELQRCEIRAEKCSLASENISFSPSFFTPQPPTFASSPPTSRKTCKTSAVEKTGDDETNTADTASVKNSGLRYPAILGMHHGETLDKVLPASFALSNFTCLSDKGATTKGKWKEDQSLDLFDMSAGSWCTAVCMEDPTYRHPHAIIDMITDTDTVSVDLSAGEVKAIIRTIKARMGISYYCDHVTLPLLVISYLGPNYGRIIQAHHDGSRMVIQYSGLFNLREPSNRDIELFLRYYCSHPARASQGLWFNKQR